MRYILILFLLSLPVYAMASTSVDAERKEKLLRIENAEKISSVRMAVLDDQLLQKEQELQLLEDSYQKTLLLKEIESIRQDIELEKIALNRKIQNIIYDKGAAENAPDKDNDPAMNLFDYFKR